ncbi:hypothetical protein D3C80_1148380 [compost metagenome]
MADLGLAGTAHVLRRRAVDAGVEQHAIQALLAQRGENIGSGRLGVEVAGDDLQARAMLGEQCGQPRGGGRIARHGEHPCAAFEPGAHQAQTDAPRGAGDENIEHVNLPRWKRQRLAPGNRGQKKTGPPVAAGRTGRR